MPLNTHSELLEQFLEEQREHRAYGFQFELGLPVVSTLIAQLQIAARHPSNVGESRKVAQEFVVGLIQRMRSAGLDASAAVAELGQDPANDQPI